MARNRQGPQQRRDGAPRKKPDITLIVDEAPRGRGRPKGWRNIKNCSPEELLARQADKEARNPIKLKAVLPPAIKQRFRRKKGSAPIIPIPLDEPSEFIEMKVSELRYATAELCRQSFYDFVQHFWHTIIHAEPVWNWHMEYLCNELQESAERVFRGEKCPYDTVINIPPGTSKSTICSVMYRAWIWTRMPHAQMIYTSHNGDLAMKLSALARKVIHSDEYKRLFPEIQMRKDSDNKGYFENTKGGWSSSVGMGSSPVGTHAHFIGVDDPIDPKSAGTDSAKLEESNEFITNTLTSRKILGGVAFMFLVQQRLSQYDPTGCLLDLYKDTPEALRHICIPAEDCDGVKPAHLRQFYVDGLMDPVRLNHDVLKDKLRRLSSYGYAGQYQQNPVPREGGMFKVDRLKIARPPSPDKFCQLVRFWDKAISIKKSGCYTVGLLMAKEIDPASKLPRFWVLDVVRGRWEVDERETMILDTARADALNYGRRAVQTQLEKEPGSSGEVDANATIRKLAGFRVEAIPASGDKMVRAGPYADMVNTGCVYLAPGDWNDAYKEELHYGKHSRFKDQIDTSSGAFTALTETNVKKPIGAF